MKIIKVKCYDGRELLIDQDLIRCAYSITHHHDRSILLLKNGLSIPLDMDYVEYLDALYPGSDFPSCEKIKNQKDYVRYVELAQKRADSGRP